MIPKVSIIVPTMNMLNFLEGTIKGIALTCDVPFELILINNASKDNSKEWIDNISEGILKQNPNFIKLTIIHNKINRFLSGAINQGVLHSCGEYISIVANDILVPPKMYSFFIDFLEKDKEHKFGAVGPYYTEDPRFTNYDSFYNNYDKIPKQEEWTNQWHFSVCHILRREDWDFIGEWDECLESSTQDVDWGFRAELAGYMQTAYKGMICGHVYGSYGRGTISNEGKVSKNDTRYFIKKWGIDTGKGVKDTCEYAKKRAKEGNYISNRQKKYLIKFGKIKTEDIAKSLF